MCFYFAHSFLNWSTFHLDGPLFATPTLDCYIVLRDFRFYVMSKKPFHILSAQMSDHILSNVYSTWDVWLCLLGWTELCISQEGKPFRLLDIKTLLYCQSELFSRLAFANLIHQGKPRLHYEKCQLFWKRTTTEANVFNIYKFGTYFPSSKQTSQLQNLFMKFKILSVITKKPLIHRSCEIDQRF